MRTKSFLWILACTAIAVLLFLVLRPRHRDQVEAAPQPPAAQVAAVQRGSISHVLSLAGQFQPYQVVDVHPKVTGFMAKINVDIGDRVHRGQTLAVLEVPELKAQLQGTVFAMQQAQAEIQRAQHEISRTQAIYAAVHADYERLAATAKANPGLIAQQELDDAQSKDLSSEAQIDAAKAAYDAARQHAEAAHADNDRVQAIQNYTDVTSPLDGVVVWRYADTGALIQSGTNSNEQDIPIVKLAQSGLLRLRMPVPEDDVQYVHVGDPMTIRVDAVNRTITGKVVRFTRDLNFETRTMETEVDVDNRDLSIDPGMYANTELQLARVDNVMTIPADAIVLRGTENTVYAVDATNHVHIRQVQTGLRGSKLVEIKSGLEPGDRVILGGQDKYQEGERVSVVLAPEPSSEVTHESGGVIDMKAEESDSNGGNQ